MTTKQIKAKRAAARKERIESIKEDLYSILGRMCVACHSCQCPEFDHIHGRTWQPRELSQLQRYQRYLAEAQKGLIQILCRHCNASDGQAKKELYRAKGGRAKAISKTGRKA
jgi:hypothetical protein